MSDLIDCPAGCGRRVHPQAPQCPGCGYRSALATFQDVLGSLSTVTSILIGFGLASLVTLAASDTALRNTGVGQTCAVLWSLSSFLLLTVLVAGEVVRRREPESLIAPPAAEFDRFQRGFGILLVVFLIALMLMALGVVCIGFFFSMWHGIGSVVAICVALAVLYTILR